MTQLLVLGLVEFVRGALVLSLLPLYGQSVNGFSLTVIGTAISLHYLFDNVFRIPAGWLIDRFGGKWLTVSGIVLSFWGICLMFIGSNAAIFMLGAAVFGLGVAPVWPAVISGIAAKIPVERIGEALSTVFMAWLVGAGMGPVVINFVIGQSYGMAFLVLLFVMVMALLFAVIGPMPLMHEKKEFSLSKYIKELGQELYSLRILYPGMFIQTMSIGILMPVMAIYARTVFGFTTQQFSYLLIGGGIFAVILLVPAGRLADRMGVKGPLVGGFLAAAVCLALLPWQKAVTHAMVVGAFLGIAYSFILPAWNGLIARTVSPQKRGTMWAIFMTIEGVGTAAGSFVGGRVWDSFGYQAPFLASSLVLIVMAVFYSFGSIDRLLAEVREKLQETS